MTTPQSLFRPFKLGDEKSAHTICTRDRRKVEIIGVLDKNIPAPIVTQIRGVLGMQNHYPNGRFNPPLEDDLDLFVCDMNIFYWL